MTDRIHIPAASKAVLRLNRRDRLRIIDPEGGQSGDLIAFSLDGEQRLSSGRRRRGRIPLLENDSKVSRELEPSLFLRDDCIVMVFRDQASTFRQLAAESCRGAIECGSRSQSH